MQVQILGSAAGGGFPQWNCHCTNCDGVRKGTIRATPRTQSSIAISANGTDWILLNASPDIRAQIASFKPLNPGRAVRDTGIRSVLLMDSQIDHTTGLLLLREGCPFDIWCTRPVHDDLTTGFPVFTMLKHWNGGVRWHEIPVGDSVPFEIPNAPAIEWTAVPLKSNAPPYSPRRDSPVTGDNIGLFIRHRDSGRSLFYAPGLGQPSERVLYWMNEADVLLVDGTAWRDDEMRHRKVGDRTAEAMGHLALTGEQGMVSLLRRMPEKRRILIHINNTNPILDEDSPERQELNEAGIEVAWDGMHLELGDRA